MKCIKYFRSIPYISGTIVIISGIAPGYIVRYLEKDRDDRAMEATGEGGDKGKGVQRKRGADIGFGL